MNADIKHSWLEALRSGTYTQVRGMLRKENGGSKHCCLGVLQDIMAPEAWAQDDHDQWGIWEDPQEDDCDFNGNRNFNEGELAYSFMCHVGLSPDQCSHLASLNDGHKDHAPDSETGFLPECEPKTFNEIADFIEENH